MKALTVSSISLFLLLALAAVPMAAAPWCATYCSCSSHCWTQCYDQGGASACDAYICDEFCFKGGLQAENAANTSIEGLFTDELFPVNQLEQTEQTDCAAPAEDLAVLTH